jgi:hypothetical protein
VRLWSRDFGEQRPLKVSRTGRGESLSGPVRIGHWRRASFRASWRVPAKKQAPKHQLVLRWEYRYDGERYPQETAMRPTDSRLAERSLVGDPTGMTTDVDYHSESGVPFLMNIPFLGVFFRSGTTVRSRTTTGFDTGISARGTWWPLESAAGSGSGLGASGSGVRSSR